MNNYGNNSLKQLDFSIISRRYGNCDMLIRDDDGISLL